MPRYIRQKTVREADRIFVTRSDKALGIVKDGKITFYPKSSYNLRICGDVNAEIKGLKRVY